VRAGIQGVLVDLPHEVGEHVDPGTTLAKVVQPDQLKATLKIAETQARDIQIGQPAEIDTHNGVIQGSVVRIDPAVQNGTVTLTNLATGPLIGFPRVMLIPQWLGVPAASFVRGRDS
jgi:HlyD family secretion protein